MINLENISQVYFVGAGGIGMSALVRYFKAKDCVVSGYDKTPTRLTREMETEGIDIHFEDDISQVNKQAQLVVYTPAIPADHKELNWYRDNNYTVVKRSDVLQAITATQNAICVSGTHGKTTISSMIAYLLIETGFGCQAFLGGIAANYDTNYLNGSSDWCVVEADEYDRSFLKLHPNVSVVSSIDPDHLDIYGTVEEMEKAYFQFINSTKDVLFYKHGLKQASHFEVTKEYTYSAQNDSANFFAQNVISKNGSYQFEVCAEGNILGHAQLNMGGLHNIENAMVALSICQYLKIDIEKAMKALAGFKGVRRRFEYVVKNESSVYIDDYAHHPEEVFQLIKSANSLFRNKKVSVVFQPHLFSRTQDLAAGFAKSLDEADEVILLDIYPARELPIEGVTSELIKDKMQSKNVHVLSKDGVKEWVKKSKPEVLITAGAGDIDQIVEPLKTIIHEY